MPEDLVDPDCELLPPRPRQLGPISGLRRLFLTGQGDREAPILPRRAAQAQARRAGAQRLEPADIPHRLEALNQFEGVN